MPRVSVVTTCYNAQDCIEKTIRSVLSQSFRDFEYIIMDGASGDETLKRAESFKGAFEKRGIAFYIYSQKDRGIYEGMNNGAGHCQGDYICFMNADDEFFDDGVLEKVFGPGSALWEAGDGDIIYGDAAELEYGQLFYFTKNFQGIEQRMPFSHQSVFAKRELLMEHPFDTSYRIVADYDFLLKCYEEKKSFLDSGVLICRVSMDGLSSRRLYENFHETEKMLNAHGIYRFTPAALKRKLFFLRIKQVGMDLLPDFVKKQIRLWQRRSRGQDRRVKE